MRIIDFTTRMIHLLSYSCSPIDARRFKESYRYQSKKRRRLLDDHVDEILADEHGFRSTNWCLLLKPRDLIKAIKQYHMVDDGFFKYVVGYYVLIFYMLSKCFFHLFFTRNNPHRIAYFERFFPRLFESYPNPDLMINLTLPVCVYCCLIRSLSLYRLVKYSLINYHQYRVCNTCQINFTYMNYTAHDMRQLVEILRYSLRHYRGLRDRNSLTHRSHSFVKEQIKECILNSPSADLIYRINVVDFDCCFEGLKHIVGANEDKPGKQDWYRSLPFHRLDPIEWALMCWLNSASFLLFAIGLPIVLVCVMYLEPTPILREIGRTTGPTGRTLFTDSIIAYFRVYSGEPWRLLRLADLYIFIAIQVPNLFDALNFFLNAGIVYSRTRKVVCCLEDCLIFCLQYQSAMEHFSHGQATKAAEDEHDNRTTGQLEGEPIGLRIVVKHFDGPERRAYDIAEIQLAAHRKRMRKLSENILHLIYLVRLLRLEFSDLKRWYSGYINVIVIVGGICIAYGVSLFALFEGFSGWFCLAMSLFGCTAPLVFLTLYALFMDSIFRRLHKVLDQILLNYGRYLGSKTLRALMVASSDFQLVKDRSIQIAGNYSITFGSIGPFIAYVSTCVLFLRYRM